MSYNGAKANASENLGIFSIANAETTKCSEKLADYFGDKGSNPPQKPQLTFADF